MIHLSMDREIYPFFGSILTETLDKETSYAFDEACRVIMGKLLQLAVDTALKNSTGNSFEYSLFFFLQSVEFSTICYSYLPTNAMKYVSPGWVMLGIALSEVLQEWLVIATRGEQQKNPEDLTHKRALLINPEQLTNETQRYNGWAVKSCKEKREKKLKELKDSTVALSVALSNDPEYQLLSSLVCYEKDVSSEYKESCLDFGTYLRNYGGEGGLSLVAPFIFDVIMQAMRIIVTVVTVNDFETRPTGVWRRGKILVLQNETLQSDFISRCLRKVNELHKANPKFPPVQVKTIRKVFQDVLRKMCHARFGAVELVYKIKKNLKFNGNLAFRSELLGSTKRKGANEKDSSITVSVIILPTPGENGAVNRDFLKEEKILIVGNFPEVDSLFVRSHEKIMLCLKAFGAKVVKKFSANTTYLLAGKDIKTERIKTAGERGARIINLSRLVKLLTGKLNFDQMHALPPLTKKDFTEANYERAVVEPVVQSMEEEADEYMKTVDMSALVPSRQPPAATSDSANSIHQHHQQVTPTPTSQRHQ